MLPRKYRFNINWLASVLHISTFILIVTLHACARGKAIGFCHWHENHQISISRHLSDSQAQRIHRNRQKTGFTVLQIVWHGPQMSQIACFVGHAYRPHLQQAMCFLLMCTTACTAKYKVVKVVSRHTHAVADLQLISAESDAACGVCALESSSYHSCYCHFYSTHMCKD